MVEFTAIQPDADSVLRSFGFVPEDFDYTDGSITTVETTFTFYTDGRVGVTMWSGSYPFANDHDMGVLPSLVDAVRYVRWLIARENFYDEKLEAQYVEPLDEDGNLVGNKYRRL